MSNDSPGLIKSVLLKIGEDLEPYVGKSVQIIGTVSNTKYPSFGDYWVTCFELDDYRGKKVHAWGILIKVRESSQGGYVQGRDGSYYHLKLNKIKELR